MERGSKRWGYDMTKVEMVPVAMRVSDEDGSRDVIRVRRPVADNDKWLLQVGV